MPTLICVLFLQNKKSCSFMQKTFMNENVFFLLHNSHHMLQHVTILCNSRNREDHEEQNEQVRHCKKDFGENRATVLACKTNQAGLKFQIKIKNRNL